MTPELVRSKEAEEILGVSKNTLDKYCKDKLIPYFRPTRSLRYFRRSDLIAFMMSNPVQSEEQLRQLANQKYA